MIFYLEGVHGKATNPRGGPKPKNKSERNPKKPMECDSHNRKKHVHKIIILNFFFFDTILKSY